MIRRLAIDLDGTLLNPQQQIIPADRRAIESSLAAGVLSLIITGRRQRGGAVGGQG